MNTSQLRRIFSTRIRTLREGKLNQGEFADSVGVSRGAMSYYEQEARTPDIGVLRAICVKYGVSADYLLGIIPDTNHAVSDVCLETGLYPKPVRRLRMLQQLRALEIDSTETILRHFMEDDPEEVLQMIPHTAATPMMNVLLSTDEGLAILTILSAIIFGAELVTGSDTAPFFKFTTNHRNIQMEYPLQNITAALWVNVQEEAARLRDRIDTMDKETE